MKPFDEDAAVHTPFWATRESKDCQLKLSLQNGRQPSAYPAWLADKLALVLPQMKWELPWAKSASRP